MNSYILITGSVSGELEGIRAEIEKPVFSSIGRRQVFSGFTGGKAVKLVITGPGLINAAQALTAVIENSRPDLIIQTGCAGVFRQSGLMIGDIAVASSETDVHLGLESETGEFTEELPFAIMTEENREIRSVYPLNAEKSFCAEIILQKVLKKHAVSKKALLQQFPPSQPLIAEPICCT